MQGVIVVDCAAVQMMRPQAGSAEQLEVPPVVLSELMLYAPERVCSLCSCGSRAYGAQTVLAPAETADTFCSEKSLREHVGHGSSRTCQFNASSKVQRPTRASNARPYAVTQATACSTATPPTKQSTAASNTHRHEQRRFAGGRRGGHCPPDCAIRRDTS